MGTSAHLAVEQSFWVLAVPHPWMQVHVGRLSVRSGGQTFLQTHLHVSSSNIWGALQVSLWGQTHLHSDASKVWSGFEQWLVIKVGHSHSQVDSLKIWGAGQGLGKHWMLHLIVCMNCTKNTSKGGFNNSWIKIPSQELKSCFYHCKKWTVCFDKALLPQLYNFTLTLVFSTPELMIMWGFPAWVLKIGVMKLR